MIEPDRSVARLQATDLSRFNRPVEGEHPSLIGGPVRTLVWRLIGGQDQAVAAVLTAGAGPSSDHAGSEPKIGVSDLLFGLAEFGIRLDPAGQFELEQHRERHLCAEIGRTMLPQLRSASHPQGDIPELSESEAADLTVDLIEACLYGREVTSPLAARMKAAIEETYGSLTDGMADWLEDMALAQWCWRQIGLGVLPSDLTRILARAAATAPDQLVRGVPELDTELRRIADPSPPAAFPGTNLTF
jgi:hypothetical protein